MQSPQLTYLYLSSRRRLIFLLPSTHLPGIRTVSSRRLRQLLDLVSRQWLAMSRDQGSWSFWYDDPRGFSERRRTDAARQVRVDLDDDGESLPSTLHPLLAPCASPRHADPSQTKTLNPTLVAQWCPSTPLHALPRCRHSPSFLAPTLAVPTHTLLLARLVTLRDPRYLSRTMRMTSLIEDPSRVLETWRFSLA